MIARQPVQLIQARILMGNLATAAFLVDVEGTLVFFNDVAGELLGLRFEEAGPMPAEQWGTRFEPLDEAGRPIPVEDLPLSRALRHGRPAHVRFHIRSLEGESRVIEVSALPLIGANGLHGALAVFWDVETG